MDYLLVFQLVNATSGAAPAGRGSGSTPAAPRPRFAWGERTRIIRAGSIQWKAVDPEARMYLNITDKVVYAKIVYYGCGLGGKTTSLNAVYQRTDPKKRHRLVALKTKGDRTLFFDLLPFDWV